MFSVLKRELTLGKANQQKLGRKRPSNYFLFDLSLYPYVIPLLLISL